MEDVYKRPFRFPSETGFSVNTIIPVRQEGKVVVPPVSGQNDVYLPCDLGRPTQLYITPLNVSSANLMSDGYHANNFTFVPVTTVSDVTALDFATGAAVKPGEVKNSPSNEQFVCINEIIATEVSQATLATAWNAVSDNFAPKWSTEGGWVKLTFVSGNVSGAKPAFNYVIEGYHL